MRPRAKLLWIIAFGCLAWAPGFPLAGGVVAQPDGRVVVVGSCQNGPDWDFADFRFNVDGSPDGSFGEEGRVVTSVSAGADFANCVTLQGAEARRIIVMR